MHEVIFVGTVTFACAVYFARRVNFSQVNFLHVITFAKNRVKAKIKLELDSKLKSVSELGVGLVLNLDLGLVKVRVRLRHRVSTASKCELVQK